MEVRLDMPNGSLIQRAKVVEVEVPKAHNSTAATAEWINLGKASRVTWLIQTGAWAGGTAAVTLKQATSDGGSSAAVSFTKYWTVAGDTVTEATASSNTFNLSAASTMYIVEAKPEMLNRASSYDWVKIAVASPGNNTDLYSITAIVEDLRHGTAVSSLT